MSLNTDHIKLIFGLKLKQLRQEKGFSLQDLSNLSKLSMSYINEIEKGKKYPKADKISALAEALEVDYDSLVSLKLNKKLEPISNLLKSNFLTEVPFDFFGIDPANLLEMLSDAPIKLSAFINTIIKIARSYSMSVEQFYFAVLRSYQEMHNNYFPDLEDIAKSFLDKNSIPENVVIDEFYLSNLLLDQYSVTIEYFDEKDFTTLATIRSVYIPKSKKLMVNKRLSSDQRAFTLAKEVGFLFMNIKTRPMTSSWIKVNSFEEVFNNFQASYFAGAILIKKEPLVKSLTELFKSDKFSSKKLNEITQKFQTTPETLLHRVFSVLPNSFGIDKLFFLRFEAPNGSKDYSLTKELHLYKQHDPQESKNENYCRRWISIKILDELSSLKGNDRQLINAQISNYQDAGNQYFVISIARPLNIIENTNVSVSLGFEISKEVSKKIAFLNDKKVKTQNVNQTCEKCSIFDCKDRVAAPTTLQRLRHIKSITEAIAQLS